jgi:hypothetical protein
MEHTQMTDETFPHEIWADLDHWIEGPAASDLRAQGYMKYLRADRIEELEAKLTACEKYRNAYAECDRIGTQSVRELGAKLAKAVSALELIAQPKVGPDFDWSHDEVNRWRDRWYRKYQNIARATLAELTGGKDE